MLQKAAFTPLFGVIRINGGQKLVTVHKVWSHALSRTARQEQRTDRAAAVLAHETLSLRR